MKHPSSAVSFLWRGSLCLLSLSLWLAPQPGLVPCQAAPKRGTAKVRVVALEYGVSVRSTRLVVAATSRTIKIPFSWQFFALVWGKRVLLIDAGMTQRRWRRYFGLRNFRHPLVLLKRLGLPPERVTDIVLTHHHVDHAGGLFLFPRATVHLHPASLRALQRSRRLPAVRRWLAKARVEKRIRLIQRQRWLTPWLHVRWTGGHTRGSLAVLAKLAQNDFLFTGDECYLQRSCLQGLELPPGARVSRRRNRLFLRFVKKHCGARCAPIPSHDPRVMKRGRSLGNGVTELASK